MDRRLYEGQLDALRAMSTGTERAEANIRESMQRFLERSIAELDREVATKLKEVEQRRLQLKEAAQQNEPYVFRTNVHPIPSWRIVARKYGRYSLRNGYKQPIEGEDW